MKPNTCRRSPRSRSGFALISALTLLVLLLLITIGMLSLSTTAVRSANQSAAAAEARANARLALMLAIGQLQQTMGPDTRISARAETLAKDKRIDAPISASTPRAWWVGASTSDPAESLDPNGGNAGTDSIAWLISGLEPQATPAEQISSPQPFRDSVVMYGENTIDTEAFTGGQPIEAGKVSIAGRSRGRPGALAWFIDDNGMKAQLAAANPDVYNERKGKPHGRGILPGTYDLSILRNMDKLAGRTPEQINRLLSINDLPLLGADRAISREKRLGYTTYSRGVLSDVKQGGLKKDLTIAFENDEVFDAVFGNKGSGFAEKYIVMDPEKFQMSSDLKKHGYIHWEMFKDFYNVKKHIAMKNGMEYLDSIMITKNGIFSGENNPFKLGALGPHDIGDNYSTASFHRKMPYGDYFCIPPGDKRDGSPSVTDHFKHSPPVAVLMRLQQNAWLSKSGNASNQRLRTNVQLWHAQYNPYNIGLNVIGDMRRGGPRIIHYPQVLISHTGVTVRDSGGSTRTLHNVSGFSGKRQTHVPHEVLLGPGRTHVYAFKENATVGRDNDGQRYDDRVRDLTLESIYREHELVSANSGTFTVDFLFDRPSLMHGADSNSGNSSHEVAQTMWAPYAWDAYNGRPSKQIRETNVGPNEINENTMASFSFRLRTTREPVSGSGPAIRPLVDANIRAMMCNTKWDSPLGVPLLAAYSAENEGEVDEQIMQMDTRDAPKGYAYWGAGGDPVDGYDRVILFDVPREDLVSLGQLQHANIGRFSYEPTYIVGNSYANLRIPLDQWKASISDTFSTAARGLSQWRIPGKFNLYDASYLVNEVLWDSYIFTTIPQVADNRDKRSEVEPTTAHFESLRKGDALLANPRFLPYEPRGSKFDYATLRETTSGNSKTGAFYHNAGHLMVDGSFNVNSTSVDAWEAFLSGTYKLAYQKLNTRGMVTGFKTDAEGVRFPRVQASMGGPMKTGALNKNFWIGFRTLSNYEVRELAEAIVAEIKARGASLTLGEFVNRRLDDSESGERGPLQAALDKTINSKIDGYFTRDTSHPRTPSNSSQGSGFPGQLLQGDILQALSPYMTVRSDSFTIRAYGESRAPGDNGKVLARAWCEATVQRYPDPVPGANSRNNPLAELVEPTSIYGRSLRMTSFRWLSPNEI